MNKFEPIVYQGSNSPILGVLIVLSFLLAVVTYHAVDSYLYNANPKPIVLFLGFIFFFLFIFWAVFMWLALKKKPSLRIDQRGITYQGFKKQIGTTFLPWEAMQGAEIKPFVRRGRILQVHLSQEYANLIDQLSKTHKFIFGETALISIDYIKGDKEKIATNINTFIHNKRMQSDQSARYARTLAADARRYEFCTSMHM